MRIFSYFNSPMPYFSLKPGFIAVLVVNDLTTQCTFVITLNRVGISDQSQHVKDENTVSCSYFPVNTKLITLPSWPMYHDNGRISKPIFPYKE